MRKRINCCYPRSLLAAVAILTASCANIVAPTGGPRDSNPPVLVNAEPENFSKRFSGNTIRLTFDEYVQVKDLNRQLIVNPAPEDQPEVKIRGKTLTLVLPGKIMENTTYSMHFGNALQDFTEGNPLKDFTFVFSSGDVIDSLVLEGVVKQASDLEPVKDIMVFLYPPGPDSMIFSSKPRYITRSNPDGSFRFTNLGAGLYRLIALEDKDQNSLADLPGEAIAFSANPAEAGPASDSLKGKLPGKSHELFLYTEKDTACRLLKAYMAQASQLVIPFTLPPSRLQMKVLSPDLTLPDAWYIPEWNGAGDTLYCWLHPSISSDSLILALMVGDRADTVRVDLLRIGKTGRFRKDSKEDKGFRAVLTGGNILRPGQVCEIRFPYPISDAVLDKSLLVAGKDSLSVIPFFPDSLKRRLQLRYKWDEKAAYQWILPAGMFRNYLSQTNDSIIIKFGTRALSDYGKLSVQFRSGETGRYILQLLSDKGQVVEETTGNESFDWVIPWISPGKYRLKLIMDRNNNSRWDGGNYRLRLQPERVEYYPRTLEIRGNWELEEKWER